MQASTEALVKQDFGNTSVGNTSFDVVVVVVAAVVVVVVVIVVVVLVVVVCMSMSSGAIG